jgi:hypothetical protein
MKHGGRAVTVQMLAYPMKSCVHAVCSDMSIHSKVVCGSTVNISMCTPTWRVAVLSVSVCACQRGMWQYCQYLYVHARWCMVVLSVYVSYVHARVVCGSTVSICMCMPRLCVVVLSVSVCACQDGVWQYCQYVYMYAMCHGTLHTAHSRHTRVHGNLG